MIGGRKAGFSFILDTSGYRSEANLKTNLLLFLAIITVISAPAAAQKRAGRPVAVLVDEIGNSSGKQAARKTASAAGNVGRRANSALPIERDVFALLNNARAEKGLPPLEWDDSLAELARMHSRNMANEKFFSHRGQDGSMVDDRAQKLGIFNWRAIGENIAFLQGYENPAKLAVEKWMNSPAHRRNVLGEKWTESAVGVAMGPDGSYYFTQVFLLR